MAIFQKAIHLPVTAAEAFAWHEAPDAFTLLTPPWEKVVVIDKEGGIRVGGFVSLEIRIFGPISIKAIYRHTQYRKGLLFVDEQEKGPFKKWKHQHRFIPKGESSCLLEDYIEFEAPIMSTWIVKRRLAKMFEYRHSITLNAMEKIKKEGIIEP